MWNFTSPSRTLLPLFVGLTWAGCSCSQQSQQDISPPAAATDDVSAEESSETAQATGLESAEPDDRADKDQVATREEVQAAVRPNSQELSTEVSRDRSARDAHEKAQQLRTAAQSASQSGDAGKAYELALEAWQLVEAHPHDGACQDLSRELWVTLEQFGESANRQAPGGDNRDVLRRPLKIE